MQGKNLNPTLTPETQSAIQRMVKYHLLERLPEGDYQVEIPLIQQWIKERAQ